MKGTPNRNPDRLIRSYSTQALAPLCAVAAVATTMDAWLLTLRIAELTRIRSMIPDGPTDDYIRTQTRDRGLSVESSMREALLSAFRRTEHKLAVSVAVRTYREEENIIIQPRAPPPPSQPALCGQCQGSIVIPCHWNNVDYCSAKCSHDAGWDGGGGACGSIMRFSSSR